MPPKHEQEANRTFPTVADVAETTSPGRTPMFQAAPPLTTLLTTTPPAASGSRHEAGASEATSGRSSTAPPVPSPPPPSPWTGHTSSSGGRDWRRES